MEILLQDSEIFLKFFCIEKQPIFLFQSEFSNYVLLSVSLWFFLNSKKPGRYFRVTKRIWNKKNFLFYQIDNWKLHLHAAILFRIIINFLYYYCTNCEVYNFKKSHEIFINYPNENIDVFSVLPFWILLLPQNISLLNFYNNH